VAVTFVVVVTLSKVFGVGLEVLCIFFGLSPPNVFFSLAPSDVTFLDAAVRKGEISRDYDDLMYSFHSAFYSRDSAEMDYLERVRILVIAF
jgi:hypothetical protein